MVEKLRFPASDIAFLLWYLSVIWSVKNYHQTLKIATDYLVFPISVWFDKNLIYLYAWVIGGRNFDPRTLSRVPMHYSENLQLVKPTVKDNTF